MPRLVIYHRCNQFEFGNKIINLSNGWSDSKGNAVINKVTSDTTTQQQNLLGLSNSRASLGNDIILKGQDRAVHVNVTTEELLLVTECRPHKSDAWKLHSCYQNLWLDTGGVTLEVLLLLLTG